MGFAHSLWVAKYVAAFLALKIAAFLVLTIADDEAALPGSCGFSSTWGEVARSQLARSR